MKTTTKRLKSTKFGRWACLHEGGIVVPCKNKREAVRMAKSLGSVAAGACQAVRIEPAELFS